MCDSVSIYSLQIRSTYKSHLFAGAKLCMILDLLGCSGSVTGVDIARHRLAASRTMMQKYALGDQCRLFVADGTTFSLAPLRAQSNSESCCESRK